MNRGRAATVWGLPVLWHWERPAPAPVVVYVYVPAPPAGAGAGRVIQGTREPGAITAGKGSAEMGKQDAKDGKDSRKPEVGKQVQLGNGKVMTTTSYEEEDDGDFTIGFTIG